MGKIEKTPAGGTPPKVDGLRQRPDKDASLVNLKKSSIETSKAAKAPKAKQSPGPGWQNLDREDIYRLLTAAFGDDKEAAEYLEKSRQGYEAFKERSDRQTIEEAIKIFVDTFERELKAKPKLKQNQAWLDFLQDLTQRLRFILASKKISPKQRDQAVKELIFRISKKIKIPATFDSLMPPSKAKQLNGGGKGKAKASESLAAGEKGKDKEDKKDNRGPEKPAQKAEKSKAALSQPKAKKTEKSSEPPVEIKPNSSRAKKEKPASEEPAVKKPIDKDKEEIKDKEVKIEFSPEVLKKAEQFGLEENDLAQIKGFNELSAGQQLLALRNLEQITLGRIQEQASLKYKENLRQKNSLARIWQGISKAYQIAKLEKLTAAEIVSGGLTAHQELLEQLAKGLKEFGPQVAMEKDKLIIQYADLPEAGPEQLKTLENFNNAAAKLSQIPYEWSLATANRKEKKQYQQALKQYEKDKAEFLKLAAEKMGEKQAASYLNEIEYKIKMNQFLAANPDLEEDGIAKIKDKKIWHQALKNIATERGIYMIGGSITRAATVSLLGTIGAPVGAAIAGGALARKRAKDFLAESEKAARRGDESDNIVVRKYSKVARVSSKVNKIIEKISVQINKINSENLNEKDLQRIGQKLSVYQKALKINVEWIESKLDRGLINFGPEKQRIVRQYNLVQTLAKGEIYLAEFQLEKRIKDRINKAIASQKLVEEAKKKEYLQDKMIRGATISALFAAAGELLAHYVGWDEKVAHSFDKNKHKLASTFQRQPATKPPAAGVKPPGSHISAPGGHKHIAVSQSQPSPSSPAGGAGVPPASVEPKIAAGLGNKQELAKNLPPVHIKIKKGDSIWTIAQKYLDKRFSRRLAQAAAGNKQALEALRTYNVDHLKDVIMKNPAKYGLPKHFNPTKLTIADLKKIDLDKAFQDAFAGQGPNLNLTPDKIQSILEQKQHLADYFHTHPAAPRTEEGYRAAEAAFQPAHSQPAAPAPPPSSGQSAFQAASPLPSSAGAAAHQPAQPPIAKPAAPKQAVGPKTIAQPHAPAKPAANLTGLSKHLAGAHNLSRPLTPEKIKHIPVNELSGLLKISQVKIKILKSIFAAEHTSPMEKAEHLLTAISKGEISLSQAAKYYAAQIKPDSLKNITDVEAYKMFKKVLYSIIKEGKREQAKLLAHLLSNLSE